MNLSRNRLAPRLITWISLIIFFTYYFSFKQSHINYTIQLLERKDFNALQAKTSQGLKEESDNQKVILLWTPYFRSRDYYIGFGDEGFRQCPVSNCRTTNDHKMLQESDAVIFHPFNMNLNALPPFRLPHQRWIFFHQESPQESTQKIAEVSDIFNWTMTYRTDSDIVKMYSDTVNTWQMYHNEMELQKRLKKKSKLAVWFVSHCKTHSRREDYVAELGEFMTVDVVGLCGKKRCPKRQKRCFDSLINQYKFYLAFENSICRDYVTEKFYNALAHSIVPVVYGGIDYSQFAPKGSYIDVRDFESPMQLADYLLYLDANQTAYEQYFTWRKFYEPRKTSAWCKLCEMLNNPSLPSQTYKNIYDWWFTGGQCGHHSPIKTSRPDVSFIWRKRELDGLSLKN